MVHVFGFVFVFGSVISRAFLFFSDAYWTIYKSFHGSSLLINYKNDFSHWFILFKVNYVKRYRYAHTFAYIEASKIHTESSNKNARQINNNNNYYNSSRGSISSKLSLRCVSAIYVCVYVSAIIAFGMPLMRVERILFLCFHLVDYVLRAFVLLLFALLIKSNGKNLFFIETLRYTTLHFRANYLRNCYLPNVIHKFIKMMSIKMIRASRTI